MITEKTKFSLYVLEPGQTPDSTGSQYSSSIEVDKDICFETAVLEALNHGGCLPVHYDLLVLCAAVEYADRRWKRPADWNRDLHLTVPMIELEKWQSPQVTQSLMQVLRFLTGDIWTFTFIQAKRLKPAEFRQMHLDLGELRSFAIAYSEGLDSRATRAISGDKDALCIRVSQRFQEPRHGEFFFTQIPFVVKNRARESSFRSRGFQFAALTSLACHLSQINKIVVPESGQGALGPAMLPLHRLYSDYRNHPSFFRKMEVFINELLEHQVRFVQPRLWFTKAQTLTEFLSLPDKSVADLIDTRSCWQTRHVVNVGGTRRQCGLCAACLLRRFSLCAAGVEEPANTYAIQNLRTADVYEAMIDVADANDQDNMIEYGIAGARHFQHLAELSKCSDEDLWVFAVEIAESVEDLTTSEVLSKLKELFSQHSREWNSFLELQGKESFLYSWVSGEAQCSI